MARCSCVGGQCNCLVVAGEGARVDGSGHPNDPYIITNTGISGSFKVEDTQTVDLSLAGNGIQADPYLLRADAKLRLLKDMLDMTPGEVPVPGDSIVVQPDLTWALSPPAITPAGAVNTRGGILGNGAFATPIEVAVSGSWGIGPLAGLGSDSTIGSPVYVDGDGKVRSAPQQQITLTWDAITGKPATFPSSWNEITGKPTSFPTTWTDITGKPATFPSTWGEVSGKPVTSTLDGRNIFVNDLAPTAAQGVNGDLWFEY